MTCRAAHQHECPSPKAQSGADLGAVEGGLHFLRFWLRDLRV